MTTVIQFPERGMRPLTLVVSGEVKALMGRYGVTQDQLGAWLGISQPGISRRLKGGIRWDLDDIERIAEGFAVHPAALMGGYATDPRPEPDGGLPIWRARRDSNPKPSDPKVLGLTHEAA